MKQRKEPGSGKQGGREEARQERIYADKQQRMAAGRSKESASQREVEK